MKNRAIEATWLIMLGVTACAVLLLPDSLAAAPQKAARAKQWKVKESTERLSITGKYLACESEEGGGEFIPLDMITALEKETLVRKPVKKAMRDLKKQYVVDWNEFGEAVAMEPRLAILAPAMPAISPMMALTQQAILAPFRGVKVNQHFVHVTWKVRGEEQSKIFRLSSKDADSLLSVLQGLTGKTPSQINVLEELEKGSGKVMGFKVHSNIAIGRTYLPAGNYRIMLVERSAAAGVLYVLRRGSLEPDDILAAVPVQISPVVDAQAPNARFEADLLGAQHLVELRIGARILHLSGAASGR